MFHVFLQSCVDLGVRETSFLKTILRIDFGRKNFFFQFKSTISQLIEESPFNSSDLRFLPALSVNIFRKRPPCLPYFSSLTLLYEYRHRPELTCSMSLVKPTPAVFKTPATIKN